MVNIYIFMYSNSLSMLSSWHKGLRFIIWLYFAIYELYWYKCLRNQYKLWTLPISAMALPLSICVSSSWASTSKSIWSRIFLAGRFLNGYMLTKTGNIYTEGYTLLRNIYLPYIWIIELYNAKLMWQFTYVVAMGLLSSTLGICTVTSPATRAAGSLHIIATRSLLESFCKSGT